MASPSPLTGVETLLEKVVDFLQNEINDPVFMADLEKFLTLAGDFLEAQIGETGTAARAPSATPYTPPSAPAVQAEGVTYYTADNPLAAAEARAAAKSKQPTVTRYGSEA